jgi:single-stranded-DNA-specific exonuclease
MLARQKTLVLAGSFHPGVAGIVAAKITEKTGKATFILSQIDTDESDAGRLSLYRGSGRSVPGIHLARCLNRCAALLIHHGGHAMAAGLSLPAANLCAFAEGFEEAAHTLWQQPETVARHFYPVAVETAMRAENLRLLSLLEPYGDGNPPPIFQSEEEMVFARTLGPRGEHLQVLLRGRDSNYRAVGFWLGDRFEALRQARRCTVRFTPILNRYHDAVSWQVRLLDIQVVGE